jgi:transposase-like protein
VLDSHTAHNPTLPNSKFNISTTMAKNRRRVDENKLQEALKDYIDNGDKSIRQIAKKYSVKRRTLQDRINGLPAKIGKKAHNRALSKIQEQVLIYWIKWLDNYNLSPTKEMVVKYANAIRKRDNPNAKDLLVKWAPR